MPRILISAVSLCFWGILTEMYRRIFDYMTSLRLNGCRSLSDKKLVAVSAKYYYMKSVFAERENFVMAMIFQYKGV